MSVYVGNPLPTTPYERARRALADLRTPSGFVLGDVIARLILDSGIVIPEAQFDEVAATFRQMPFYGGNYTLDARRLLNSIETEAQR